MVIAELRKIGLSLAKNLHSRLDEILAKEFPTDTPKILGNIIRSIVTSTALVVESEENELALKYACEYLQEISSHLRYIEGATSPRIPTSIITPVETLIRRFEPNARVMLRVQSSYNYTIFDIVPIYREMFSGLIGHELNDILGSTECLYIVAVPSVEHSNVLLHSILGHELGHKIAERYLATQDEAKQDEAKFITYINDLVGDDLTWWDPEIEKLPPLFKLQHRQRIFELIIEARRRALEELISDIVAYHLLGLSALLALEQFSCSDVLDELPCPEEFYPPWRYRIRQVVTLAYADGLTAAISGIDGTSPTIPLVRKCALERLEHLRQIVSERTDLERIESHGILKRAYKDVPEVLERCRPFILNELRQFTYNKDVFEKEVGELLDRLSLGIPPDELRSASITETPDIRSALSAGWLYRVARLPIPYNPKKVWHLEDDGILNRLVLKAIETIHLVADEWKWRQTE